MEQLKVKKKDPVVLNTIIYLFLSFVFLYLQYAYRHQLSPISVVYLRKSVELFWYITIPMALAIYLIWRMDRLASYAYGFCILLVSFKVVEGLFIEFNKIIVVALFFYTVIAYFLYQLLNVYWGNASINSNYRRADLFSPLLKTISATLSKGDKSITGSLTNWDGQGCFIKLSQEEKLSGWIKVRVNFQDKEFIQEGEVVAHTHDFTGVGIRFKQSSKDLKVFNWAEFTELIQELGFEPERLR
jgi:hypothetical protein